MGLFTALASLLLLSGNAGDAEITPTGFRVYVYPYGGYYRGYYGGAYCPPGYYGPNCYYYGYYGYPYGPYYRYRRYPYYRHRRHHHHRRHHRRHRR